MLGRFENFPIFVHKEKKFRINASMENFQKKILESLYKLNGKEISPKQILDGTDAGLKLIFEIGLAEGLNFNYLDNLELERCLNFLKNGVFNVLDFFVVNRYYRVDGDKRKPLRFDYQLLRLEFLEKTLVVRVYHEKGPRRIQLEDLIDFLAKQFLQS
ncbi:hypothetical protein DRO54_00700 [Candidatus Bathyarchaeota archaeon]|nr:MAG: hypothetical protein DRO54_00700 [Candidatus Bathyarchaeota archaeon]